jgi:hypothetical protein
VPETEVLIFTADDGTVPLLEWMDQLQVKVRDKCIVGGGEKLVHFGGLLDPLEARHFRPASGVKAERSEPVGLGLEATG